MIKVFVGYDTKEIVSYHVCTNSIIRQASKPVSVIPLALTLLDAYKETHTDGSNDFVYTRFLVPYLNNYTDWALFIDGDMILQDDIVKLWNLRDETKAVMVVKHSYQTKMSEKYFGSKNKNYPRKNWSSVILWNCKHPANKLLTPAFVENSLGSYLHRFSWLPEELIGELPVEWNWLADEFGENTNAKLVHYTLGSPCFNNNTPMADIWYKELSLVKSFKET